MLSCWKEIGVSFFLLIYSKAGALSSNIPPSILQPRLPQRTPQPCYITGKSLLSFFLEVMSFFSPLFCLSASRCCFGETTSLQLLQHSSFLFFFMLHISAPKGGGGSYYGDLNLDLCSACTHYVAAQSQDILGMSLE